MNRLAEILKRLKEIETEVRSGNVSDELNAELDLLLKEKKEIEAKQLQMAARFEEASLIPNNQETPENRLGLNLSKMSLRDKLSYVAGKQARNKVFSDVERRALGKALTTTATTFIEATADLDGINNAGILISTKLVFDLLREERKLSPILADINFMNIPGYTEFPYRAQRDKARKKAEGAAGSDNQMKWAKLQLASGYLQTIIPVTDQVMALTDFDFGVYIMEQLLEDINDDWAEQLIYGSGTDDEVKGVTIGATAALTGGYDEGSEIEAIVAGIKLLTGKFRRGAKIYAAQDVADSVLFATDELGNFKYQIFNNTASISSIGPIRIEVEENLKPGDFVIGNINKFFKANNLIPIRIETDRLARKGITEYIASGYSATAPFPGAIVYGKKK